MRARKIKLGVTFVIVIILVQILAATAYIFYLPLVYDPQKLILFTLNQLYAYISVLMVLRALTFASAEVNKYLTLIIRFEILKVLTSFLLTQLASFISLVVFVLYISLIVAVLKKENKNIYEIKHLRPTAHACILSFSVATVLLFVYPGDSFVLGIAYLVNSIPYLFLIAYLMRIKSKLRPSNMLSNSVL